MFDLKMCFLDFMRLSPSSSAGGGGGGPTKSRKYLRAIGGQNDRRFSTSHYMQKYNDVNIIYFNENMSMTSKSNTIKFSRCPAGTFKESPLNQSFSNRKKSIRDWEVETACYDFSSDDRTVTSSSSSSSSSVSTTTTDSIADMSPDSTEVKSMKFLAATDSDATECLCRYAENTGKRGGGGGGAVADEAQLDSFCTLCTSSFSFSHCNKCDESRCSSKCQQQSADEISFKSYVEKSFVTRRYV